MAELNGTFGELNGTIGNLVFKKIEGKQIVQAAPSGRNIVSEPVLATISRFRVINDAYSGICGIKSDPGSKDIRILWRRAYPRRLPLNSFFTKVNSEVIYSIADISKVILSPTENCFPFPACQLIRDDLKFRLVIQLDATLELNPDTENYIEAAGFACMTDPLYKGVKPIIMKNIISDLHRIEFNQELVIPLSTKITNDVPKYNKIDFYLVLITLTEKDNPVRTSVKKILPMPPE